jgi:hypothetical protein
LADKYVTSAELGHQEVAMKGIWGLRALATLFLIGLPEWASASEPISAVLSLPATQTGTRASVVLTIKNDGDVPVTLNKFFLPFDWNGPLPNSQFDVYSLDSQEQKYSGDWDYIVDMQPDAYITLGAHQTLSGTVDLWKSYTFDTQVDTRFTAQFHLQLGILPEGTEPDEHSPTYSTNLNRARTITSNALQLNVDPWGGNASKVPAAKPTASDTPTPVWRPELQGAPGYAINDPTGTCSPDQASMILSAYTDANKAIVTAIYFASTMFDSTGFNPSNPASVSWNTWFGTYDGDGKMPGEGGTYYSSAGKTVATYRAAEYATEAHSGLSYFPETECKCPPDTRPDVAAKARESYHILMCPKFFQLKAIGGPNSRALTLFHEMTHFRSAINNGTGGDLQVAATVDWAYTGYSDRQLAILNQAKALGNAENYEKFALDALRFYAAPGW